jgi:hypothetical protein
MRSRGLSVPLVLPPHAQQVVGLKGAADVEVKPVGARPLQYMLVDVQTLESFLKTSLLG